MIPPNSQLKSRLTPEQGSFIILNPASFFEKAEKYTELSKKFLTETILDKISLWIEMVVSPIVCVCMFIYYQESPSFFNMLSMHKAITLWMEWFEFDTLNSEIREWTKIVKSADGPFISANDSTYHVFVYADGMERLRSGLFGLSEKGTERLQ